MTDTVPSMHSQITTHQQQWAVMGRSREHCARKFPPLSSLKELQGFPLVKYPLHTVLDYMTAFNTIAKHCLMFLAEKQLRNNLVNEFFGIWVSFHSFLYNLIYFHILQAEFWRNHHSLFMRMLKFDEDWGLWAHIN